MIRLRLISFLTVMFCIDLAAISQADSIKYARDPHIAGGKIVFAYHSSIP